MQVIEQLKVLSNAQFLSIYETLAEQGFGPLDLEVAKAINFRPQAIRKLPFAQRAKKARQIVLAKHNAEMCYEMFGAYLIKTKKELVTKFLDATGVEHEDGMVEDLDKSAPQGSKVAAIVAELDQQFPPDDVTIYLSMCAQQWPGVPEITNLWRERIGAKASA
jgi:hypothetical protein